MKKLSLTLLAAAFTVASALSLTAQRPEGPRSEGQRRPPSPPPFVMALDLDRDGVISSEELANASKSLARLDRNEDGQITRDELRGPRPGGRGGRQEGDQGSRRGSRGDAERPEGRPQPQPQPGLALIRMLDADGDGSLSSEEIAGSPKNLLTLDSDEDGSVSREELRSARPDGSRSRPESGAGKAPQRPRTRGSN